MRKQATLFLLLLLFAGFVCLNQLGVSLRKASLVGGINALNVARADYLVFGYLTNNLSSGFKVSLSTNILTIGGTQHVIFAKATGGYGWAGGVLSMTTNGLFVWEDTKKPPKLISITNRPPSFLGTY